MVKDAVITGIPMHQSKVSFKCIKGPETQSLDDSIEKNNVNIFS